AASVRGREGSERVAGELYRHAEKLRHEPVLCGIGQSDRVELEVDVQGHDRRGRHLQRGLIGNACHESLQRRNGICPGSDADAYSDTYTDPDTNAHSDTHPDTHAYADPGAGPERQYLAAAFR